MKGILGMGPLWSKGDFDAVVGVFVDGFAKVITAAAVLQFTIKLPAEVVYGRILPAVGLTVFVLNLLFTLYSRYLNMKENRNDYVALPTGLHATRVFTWLFAIMMPVYFATGDGIVAWKVGVMCNLLSSIIFIITGFISGWLEKNIPTAALFGTLAGGAIGVLGVNILAKMFNQPLIGFVATFALLIMYLGKIEGKIPAPLISIGLGTIVAWIIGVNNMETLSNGISNSQMALPGFFFDFLNVDFKLIAPYLGIVVVFTVHGAINSLMGVKQAQEVGDNIDGKKSILMIGIINILSCFIGNPFPLGVFWGHNTWKELKAGTSYSSVVGIVYAVLCFSGLIAVINGIIPEQATLPILLFIALTSVAQSFKKVEFKYYPVIGITIALSLLEIMYDKTEAAMKAILNVIGQNANQIVNGSTELYVNLTANKMDAIGYMTLGKGAMFTSIVWGSIFVFAIDRNWSKAALAAIIGAILTFFGMIHSVQPGVGLNIELACLYGLLSITLYVIGMVLKNKKSTEV